MPYEFRFYINHELHFRAKLYSEQCTAQTEKGQACKRICCIGTPFCWTHLLFHRYLRIKQSTIPGAGKGLFAVAPKTDDIKQLVFYKNEKIIEYDGELMHHQELEKRYGRYTAPYGVVVNEKRDLYEDGALQRGAGTLCNHATGHKANARLGVSHSRIVLYATRRIMNGEEIFVNYGARYKFNEPTEYSTTAVR